jgi:TRAP-type C4-dicarboxylate transport system permease large subunit
VPIESVGLKLFTGIENFEIMAVPFFILSGNFLTHGGVAKRMIAFATSMVGHLHGGLALAGILAAHVLGVSGMLWLGAATAAGLTVFIFCVPSVRALDSRRAQAEP